MGRILTAADVESAVKGGSVFACGGGGWARHGRELGRLAVTIGRPELVTIDELPPDAWVATSAAIGAPGDATAWEMLGVDYVKAVELAQEALGAPIAGLIIGQNGMSSTLNAWLPAALLGLKVVDAVGDIRAHPTGDMGSLGMANSPEPMIQTAVGGNRAAHAYIELVVRGATAKVSPILRKAADLAGGFIASCRNPIPAHEVKTRAALGGIGQALALGETIIGAEERGGPAVIDAICGLTKGTILGRGIVTRKTIAYTAEAFDIGVVEVTAKDETWTIHTMNEYMAVDAAGGGRRATYPDVIATLGDDGIPISAGHLKEGTAVHIFHIAAAHLPLSASISDPSVYPPVERALGISIADYALRQRS